MCAILWLSAFSSSISAGNKSVSQHAGVWLVADASGKHPKKAVVMLKPSIGPSSIAAQEQATVCASYFGNSLPENKGVVIVSAKLLRQDSESGERIQVQQVKIGKGKRKQGGVSLGCTGIGPVEREDVIEFDFTFKKMPKLDYPERGFVNLQARLGSFEEF